MKTPAYLFVCVVAILHFSTTRVFGGQGLHSNLHGDTDRVLEVANKSTSQVPERGGRDESPFQMAEILVGRWRGEVSEPDGTFRSYLMMMEFRLASASSQAFRIVEGRVRYSEYECKGALVQQEPVSTSGDDYFVFRESIVEGGRTKNNPNGCDDGVIYIKVIDQDTLKWQWGWSPKGNPSAWATLFRVN